jgi:hypothetical protein
MTHGSPWPPDPAYEAAQRLSDDEDAREYERERADRRSEYAPAERPVETVPFRLLVTGGRTFANIDSVRDALADIARDHDTVRLVHGDARGLDRLAASEALRIDWTVEPHPADWQRYRSHAGPIRNQEMVDAGADLCLAFFGGAGTRDCRHRAIAAGIPVRDVEA